MKVFYQVLANTLLVTVINNYVWFALTFWAYVETRSVLATSIMGGVYLVLTAVCGFWFGSIVDHHKKKTAMYLSSFLSLGFFSAGLLLLLVTPPEAFKTVASVQFWAIVLLLLAGTIAGNIRNIVLPTLTTLLVEKEKRDRANGLSGSMMGIGFAITSVGSGLVLGFAGMSWVLISASAITLLAIAHLRFIAIPEKAVHPHDKPKKLDIKGTIAVVSAIPGLLALILFGTFNNFLGGVFMALMDAYGLSLVSIQEWGLLWGFLSFGIILGGFVIAKRGLGKNPLKTIFQVNIIMWTICIFFTIQASIFLLTAGMFLYMCLIPFVEAAEQTIIQQVVPHERQGRVFGFAQSVEQAASPLTAFLIGPIAQFIFIPFMTTGAGVDLIGDWFGTGLARGIALVFIITGIIGLIVTLLSMRLKVYKQLAAVYQKS